MINTIDIVPGVLNFNFLPGGYAVFEFLNRKKGLSIIEIIVVLVLLSIVLAIGVPYFLRSKGNTQVRTQAKQLKADLEYARSIARTQGGEVTFAYSSPAESSTGYEIVDTDGQVKKVVEFEGSVVADYSSLSSSEIIFKSNGSCSAGGEIKVKNTGTDKTFTLTLNETTGMVKLEEN